MKKRVPHPRWGEITVSRTRSARRILISVRPPGSVRLTIPAACSLRSGLAFVDEKEEWIESALRKIGEKYPERAIIPPYRTAMRELVFNPCSEVANVVARVTADKITVAFPANLTPESEEVQGAVGAAVLRALRAEAKEILPAMTDRLAREHGFRYRNVAVRATKSRWGSCSARDDISLSIYLVSLPPHLIEYIILHELCHTRHKNHSAEFHALLDSHLGGREKEFTREIRNYRPGLCK